MSSKSAKYDDYWRTNDVCSDTKKFLSERLLKAGYEVKKSATRDELVDLVLRSEQGGLCYDSCTQLELKQFAVNRGLVDVRKTPTKRWLADKLMEADKNRTFRKFFDLPPELRKTVYEFYFAVFEHRTLHLPSQPPLARACHLARKEVLPLFYSSFRFRIKFQTTRSSTYLHPHFRLNDHSHIFLTTLAPGCLADMQKLELDFNELYYPIHWQRCKFRVNLDPRRKLCQICHEHPTRGSENVREYGRAMRNALKRTVKRMLKRESGAKLRMKDFYALGAAVERAIKLVAAEEEDSDDGF